MPNEDNETWFEKVRDKISGHNEDSTDNPKATNGDTPTDSNDDRRYATEPYDVTDNNTLDRDPASTLDDSLISEDSSYGPEEYFTEFEEIDIYSTGDSFNETNDEPGENTGPPNKQPDNPTSEK